MSQTEKRTGTIKFFNFHHRYGIIVPDPIDDMQGIDVYLHQNAIQHLKLPYDLAGTKVRYESREREDGPGKFVAFDVEIIGLPFDEFAFLTGTVRSFTEERGYGFINPDDGGSDVLLHKTEVRKSKLRRDPRYGDRLRFVLGQRAKGRFAHFITMLTEGPPPRRRRR